MKTKLFYIIFILFSYSCRPNVTMPLKNKKIVIHTFTGKGYHDETTNWFYIRNIIDRGFSGYYFASTSAVNDFKQANFMYFKTRPPEFEGQAASNEMLQFLNPGDLPDELLEDLSILESSYK